MTFDLDRFVKAQEYTYDQAYEEIKSGHKEGHWIWFIFPQIKGLGSSYDSWKYGLDGLEEAIAYYNHPLLKERLVKITKELLNHKNKDIEYIAGSYTDALKIKSSMTIFYLASNHPLFKEVLDTFYNGKQCIKTLENVKENY